MKALLALLMCSMPLVMVSCKTEAKKVDTKIVSRPELIALLDKIFIERMGFKAIKCPFYLQPYESKNKPKLEQHCFASQDQPEDLLVPFSGEFAQMGKVQMQWRLDVGMWVTTYEISKELQFLAGLQSPSEGSLMRDDPAVKNYGTIGWFLL